MGITAIDKAHLRTCISLAREAALAGDFPFGSVLVDSTNTIRYTDRNRVISKADVTWHPEFTIVVWAQTHMTAEERATSTVYTSGEHCAMCSTAHGFAGLGRIVFASSTEQLEKWLAELGVEQGGVRGIRVNKVLPELEVDGPDEEFAAEVRKLHVLRHGKNKE